MSLLKAVGTPDTNLLLAALPRQEYERLISKMTLVQIAQGKLVYHMGQQLRYAYFINNGMISILLVARNGSSLEVGIVGREGVIGIPIILGMNETPYEMGVQIEVKSAWRIKAEVFKEEFNRGGKFQELLLKYTNVMLTQLSQSAICNRFHTSEQRLGHWLLIVRDRVNSDSIDLTQESIAHMLGGPRTAVTMTAGNLQREGLIRYSRGKITILDADGLRNIACECYEVIKDNLDTHIGHLTGGQLMA
ncbi:MAG TPA: Crp/Fnr family transcriptional regulator [Pyrinomonadaceae bacterium]